MIIDIIHFIIDHFFISLIIGLVGFYLICTLAGAAVVEVSRSFQRLCPGCNKRGGIGWLHGRVDGGPDLRYKHNYIMCFFCDWTETPATARRVTTIREGNLTIRVEDEVAIDLKRINDPDYIKQVGEEGNNALNQVKDGTPVDGDDKV